MTHDSQPRPVLTPAEYRELIRAEMRKVREEERIAKALRLQCKTIHGVDPLDAA